MCRVSVITPAYNASKYIGDTVASVRAQSFVDWEMIIVDDCSIDDTYQLVAALASEDARIKVIKHQSRRGVAAARNTALDLAVGEYMAFLDCDDLWLPDKLQKQIEFMVTNGYVLTYTMYQKFASETGKRGKIIKVPNKMTANDILGNTAIGCLTVMVNRKRVGVFHMPLIKHTEDNCTWQEILSRGYVAYGLKENLALYRVGNVSLSSNKMKAARLQWDTYREYYKFSVFKSSYYFLCYAFHAVKKHY